MRILFRNFTRLLSIGAFGADRAIEEMSEYKWNKLLLTAKAYGVEGYVCSGIVKSDEGMIPHGIYEQASGGICQTQATAARSGFAPGRRIKKFSNFHLNNKLNKIIFDEIHSIDTSINSLTMLCKLIDNINNLLDKGVDITAMADLGAYLRAYGDKIDFVKIEAWIKLLGIRKMCNIVCCCLISLFSFEAEEFPFIKEAGCKYRRKADLILSKAVESSPELSVRPQRKETDGQGINPISKPNTSPLRFFKYMPVETSSRFIANIAKSLSNIDE